MSTCLLHVPAPSMVLLKGIVESYDNLATLRTEDPERELLRVYFSPQMEEDVRAVLSSLSGTLKLTFVDEPKQSELEPVS